MCLCASVKKEPNASIKILCASVTKEPMYLRQELKCLYASVKKEPNASIKSLCAYVHLSKKNLMLPSRAYVLMCICQKNLCVSVKSLCAYVYKKGEKVQKKWGRNIFVK